MRLLHVVPYYEQAWAYGGIPRLATTMTRALARRGHQVTVCTTDARDEQTRASLPGGIGPHGVNVRMFRNISNSLAYHLQFFTPVGLRRYIRRAAATFDLAHIHACHNLPGVLAAAELARAGVPYVVSPNGTAEAIERRIVAKRLFTLTVGRSMLPAAARVVAVSSTETRQLRASGVRESAIAHIPNPIDEREFDSQADASGFRARIGVGDAPVVLFLGKLTPRKGVSDLVRAFARLDAPAVFLVVAGNDMGTRRSIESLIEDLQLHGRVILTGLLTGQARLDALAAASVLVYPSRDEIFGLVPLEALLCGTPVVVCDDSGCGEVIASIGGGQVVPHGDIDRLAEAIRAVLVDERTWRARARAAASIARQRFGSEVVCDQLESLYAAVLEETSRARRIGA